MRGFVLTVLLLAAGVDRLQGQADVNQCRAPAPKTRCNVALCLQKSDNAVNTDTNANIAKAILRDAYSPDAQCEGNFGCAFYGETIGANDVCPMWPRDASRRKQNTCLNQALAAQTNDPKTGNYLDVCLSRFNTDEAFFRYDRRGDCRLTVGVIADRDIARSAAAIAQAEALKRKGVFVVCFLVGNTQVAYDPAYNTICDDLYQASDFPELWRGVEEMYGQIKCCDDPIPPPTTTTTTPTTTTTTPTTTTTTPTTTTTTPTTTTTTPTTTTTTPTTTTTTPTTTTTTETTTTRKPSVCDGCKIVNGVGYIGDVDRCDCWKRCLFNEDNEVYAITNCCQCGMFWDQDLLACMPAADIRCPADPCRRRGVRNYAYANNCRAYWICDGRRSSDAKCCADNEEFNPTSQQCEVDANNDCNDPCPCDLETTSRICPFQPNPLDRHTYFVPEHDGSAPRLMDCPPGTDYNATACKCSIFLNITTPPCPADFDMRCTEKPVIDHANNAYIANFDVTIDPANSVCSFSGNDRFVVPRYANYDWRNRFAIYSSFNGDGNTNNNAPLVSNTDCDEPSSVELRLVRSVGGAPFIEAYIKTTTGRYTTRVPYRENSRNEAYMYYDGENLRLCVRYADGTVDSNIIAANGMVGKCRCALQIGYGWQNRYFTGRIFDTRIYINCIPDNFCPS